MSGGIQRGGGYIRGQENIRGAAEDRMLEPVRQKGKVKCVVMETGMNGKNKHE